MEYVWIVRFAESKNNEDILIFDNPTTAYDACVDYINNIDTMDDFIEEYIEELRSRFLDSPDEFWCEEVCWCWKQKVIKS